MKYFTWDARMMIGTLLLCLPGTKTTNTALWGKKGDVLCLQGNKSLL
jgi:hypothetical protein